MIADLELTKSNKQQEEEEKKHAFAQDRDNRNLLTIKCRNCNTNFDFDDHEPFVLTCGHSICLKCSNENTRVTCCKGLIKLSNQYLPKNYTLIELLKQIAGIDLGDQLGDIREKVTALGNPKTMIAYSNFQNTFSEYDFE